MLARLHHFFESVPGKVLLVFILLIAVYIPVFLHLGNLPIAIWDESLFALRALYMFQNGAYLHNFNMYEGLIEHQNTKLPFTTLLQVAGFYLFGANELGLRLPVAFVFTGTLAYTAYFLKRETGSYLPGIVFTLVLIASTGWVQPHMLRTGDQDAPFACFLFLAVLFFYKFVKAKHTGDLVLFCFWIFAALFTKNLLAGIIGPALLLYVFAINKWKSTLSDKRIYIALFGIIAGYIGLIGYFEYTHQGFFERMWNYELSGRYSETIEGHRGSPFFYLQLLYDGFNPFIHLLWFVIPLLTSKRLSPALQQLSLLSLFVFLNYLLVISFSGTKTTWYHAPLFLQAALMVSILVHYVYQQYFTTLSLSLKYACILACLLFYALPYASVFQQVYHPQGIHVDEYYGHFIQHLNRNMPEIKQFTIVDHNYGTGAYFYKEMYNMKDPAYHIDYKRYLNVQEGEVIMSCLNSVLNPLNEQFNTSILAAYSYCRLIRLENTKTPSKDNKPDGSE